MRFISGLPETACGAGSTLAATAYLRTVLPDILARHHVRTLLDAPCGDFNWMARADLSGVTYVGADLSAENLATATQRSADQRGVSFIRADLCVDDLPKCDAILSRDFFQHLPNAMALQALANFKRTGARLLLATTFYNATNSDIAEPGGFRPLNLCAAPFSLGEPIETHPDPPGSERVIGIWRLQ